MWPDARPSARAQIAMECGSALINYRKTGRETYARVRMRAYVALSRSLSYIAYKKRALRPVVHSERC